MEKLTFADYELIAKTLDLNLVTLKILRERPMVDCIAVNEFLGVGLAVGADEIDETEFREQLKDFEQSFRELRSKIKHISGV